MYQGKYQNSETESPKPAPRRRAAKKRKTAPRKGTIVFYGIYGALILMFFIGMGIAMNALKNWLVSYEASQPKVKCQQVFEDLFADPDWAELYTLANCESSAFENKDTYAAHMESALGDTELTYVETSAGLSGDKKYIVKAGSDKIATFTLTAEDKDAKIPDWQLGTVELFYDRNVDLTVITDPDCTVTVNGVALDESYTVRTVSTAAENYLPEGVHGYRLSEKYVSGLLCQPQVAATDANGEPVELSYDAATRTYTQDLTPAAIGNSEQTTLVTAAKTYCQYMIGAVGSWELRSCFDPTTQIYNTITTNATWMQGYTGYDFGDAAITNYYRYSDDLYSAIVSISLNVTRKNGTVKEYSLSSTFLLENQSGSWMVTEMTNVDIQEQTTLVRLTYKNGDTLVSSELVDAETSKLTPPAVTAPEGQVFSGWFTETVDEKGNKTMSLAFLPGEDGSVSLPSGSALEPMTLYALFEAEEG